MSPVMLELAASDDHVVKCTKVSQYLAIFINFAKSMFAHDLYVPAVVWSDFGVQVSHECYHVLLLQFVTQCLQFVIAVFFYFFILVVCG